MVLLITSSFDDECDAVVKELKKLGSSSYFRLNADRLYDCYRLDIDINSASFEIRHKYTGQKITSKEVKTVWWARYALPGTTYEFFAPHLSPFIDDEYYSSLIALMACLDERPVRIINHPVKHILGGHKPYQQVIAAACGMQLPRQLITNHLPSFASQSWHTKALFKPISNSQYLNKGKERYFATVKRLNGALLNRLFTREIDVYVHHFQEQLPVKKEYRVNAFGSHVFAFRIDGTYDFDWRQYLDKIKFTLQPDFPLKHECLTYLKKMGIEMGCFDFIETTDGHFYFIECNAPGYFMFCDPRNKYGQAQTFASFLLH